MKPRTYDVLKVLRDSSLGCGPTTRGLRQRTGGQFWWGWAVLRRLDTGYSESALRTGEGKLLVS